MYIGCGNGVQGFRTEIKQPIQKIVAMLFATEDYWITRNLKTGHCTKLYQELAMNHNQGLKNCLTNIRPRRTGQVENNTRQVFNFQEKPTEL